MGVAAPQSERSPPSVLPLQYRRGPDLHDLKTDPITAEQHRGRSPLSLLSMLPAGAHDSAEHGVIHGACTPCWVWTTC